MRYPAAEKLEIIRLVEQSPLSVRRTLAQLGIPRSPSTPGTSAIWRAAPGPWNKLPDTFAEAVVGLALKEPVTG